MLDINDPDTFIQPRWKFCSARDTRVNMPAFFLKTAIDILSPLYSCNRPPGAAGAILETKSHVIIAPVIPTIGYPTCKHVGCDIVDGHCVRAIHAERRALLWAARYGLQTDASTVYSILKPCYECTKELIAAGVKLIYYAGIAYDEDRTKAILKAADVLCIAVDVKLEYGNA